MRLAHSDTLENAFPWCAEWENELKVLFRGYVEAKQRDNVLDYDDLLLYWADMMEESSLARLVGDQFDLPLNWHLPVQIRSAGPAPEEACLLRPWLLLKASAARSQRLGRRDRTDAMRLEILSRLLSRARWAHPASASRWDGARRLHSKRDQRA